ncbi:MAG: alpha-amylase, partial [Thermoanaerobaculia bacterium]
AERLGGEEALSALRRRAAEHGLRLAADMVPDHTGVDSQWVLDHPERFIGQTDCPFPGYSFDGPDLSPDPSVAIHIEDHYYDRSDAAVVFRRTDRASGEVRYIYHGNDGTSMPWNDTAQLDYLRPETREAVIRQILEVARNFSVIRFDAAMTLTRHHFQRLWFPRPGDAGAIPSRAEWALPVERFDELMPTEFWREVVDRVAAELPDTLLVAEAFWLLEGYFVRSLGMHRVYNSAFMHMLRDGDTAGYRKLLRETLEFDPAILERYVSFMSNPDEATAAEQFGTGERYRGVCLLLATLPGLPMFAHGQVEGFCERYGMEYGRSYRDERPNAELVSWHEQQVAPLLLRRDLFAGTSNFQLFDFRSDSGEVDESVLAYTNGVAGERLLAVYNHSEGRVRGRIRESVPRVEGGRRLEEGAEKSGLAAPLTAALALDPTRQRHLLRDRLSGAEQIVDYAALVDEGLALELGPYEFLLLEPAPGESTGI